MFTAWDVSVLRAPEGRAIGSIENWAVTFPSIAYLSFFVCSVYVVFGANSTSVLHMNMNE